MKNLLSRSCLSAFLIAASAGSVHAAECPDRSTSAPAHQASSASAPDPGQGVFANPWAELVRLQAAMARQFDALNSLPVMFVPQPVFMMPTPVSTLQATEDGYRIEIPLPGFKPEDVKVHLDGKVLSVAAETSKTSKVGDQDVQGRSEQRFAETLTLPASVKTSKYTQDFENGVLILTFPHSQGTT